jgi:hypothetical protein
MGKDNGATPKEHKQEAGEEAPVSRIEVVFVGPGMADIGSAKMENVTLGQLLVFAQWAQWQADVKTREWDEAKAKRQAVANRVNKIIVPQGVGLQ